MSAIVSVYGIRLELSAISTFSISCCSSASSSLSLLLRFTTVSGSMKRVMPVDEESCTMPGTLDLYSALTGRQYLPSLWVIIASVR